MVQRKAAPSVAAPERHPSGRRKEQEQHQGVTPAVWGRLKAHGLKLGADARLVTQLGRLGLTGELTAAQVAAGFRVAEIYGRYERYKGRRRSAASPSYEQGFGNADLAEERMSAQQLVDHEERIRKATADWQQLQDIFDEKLPRGARRAIEELCVDDCAPAWAEVPDLAKLLSALAREFGDKWRKGRSDGRKSTTAASTPVKSTIIVKRRQAEVVAFEQVLTKLRPDLDEAGRQLAIDTVLALREREEHRRRQAQRLP